ncbi:dienelactone hydrolase family protein [Leeia sp. TBRC 13508]|uniref:Dienelactone hydrolase family protein n=1 Tax=Leeia speluncae TaxID=2884804 RepID=A0ABS8DB18_9NEIS|nr:dienelactone hydrolase family protein [Leeia speluncae]MCB6185400.1 dienelactone hydrolase family protein [Leeia speluncae]
MRATLVTPDGGGTYPGILLLHTSSGFEQADITYAEKLAQAGYVVLVPEFLSAYGITAKTRQITFTSKAEPIYNDFVAALDTLSHLPKVAGHKIGAIGFSNGGYFSMWLAATNKVQAGISYYGALSGAGSDKSLERFSATFNSTSAPVLILHGTNDATVPVSAAKRLDSIVASSNTKHETHFYEGADHRFERDDSDANNAAAKDAWIHTLSFFRQYLN